MKYILSNLPEKLGDDEINEMLRTADKVIKFFKVTILVFCGKNLTFFLLRTEMVPLVMKNSGQ
jgi:hypothetical protein